VNLKLSKFEKMQYDSEKLRELKRIQDKIREQNEEIQKLISERNRLLAESDKMNHWTVIFEWLGINL
jgi:hypothetical protein